MVKKRLTVRSLSIVGLIMISAMVACFLGGCAPKPAMYAPEYAPEEEAPAMKAPVPPKVAVEVAQVASERLPRLVIRTGTIHMVVKDIAAVVGDIIRYTESKGGWVVSSSVVAEKGKTPSGSITVRVPAEIFDEAMVYFKGLAERVTYEETQGEDVTEEYVDLQSRLRNLQATEAQLLKIMERSGTIADVLAVQREVSEVREQIEQTKGRIQYLEKSAQMATIKIDLALSEELLPIPPAEKWRPIYVLKQAWRSLLGVLRGISYILIWIGVYAIIWVPLGIGVWQGIKFLKNKKKKLN